MFIWPLAFLVLALIAGVLGFTDIAGQSMSFARPLFIIFLIIFLAGLAYRVVMGKRLFGS